MKKIKFNIANRISIGYIIVILVATIACVTCIFSLEDTQKIDHELSGVLIPTINLAKDLKLKTNESKKLTNNWIYLPSANEKARFTELHSKDLQEIKAKFDTIFKNRPAEDSTKIYMAFALSVFEKVLSEEKKITQFLPDDEAYGSDSLVDLAINTFDQSVKPGAEKLEQNLAGFIDKTEAFILAKQIDKDKANSRLSLMMIITIVLIVIVGLVASYYSTITITKPLTELKSVILTLGKGEVTAVKDEINVRTDEIGEMAQAINNMATGISEKAKFAVEIGKGKYESTFNPLGENDVMGMALIEMRNNLQKSYEEDRKRSWATTGMAQISEILRNTNASSEELFDDILRFIVKYTESNQGRIYLLDEEMGRQNHLNLVACYAFDKKKYLNHRIETGEGLIGQSVLEKDIIYITEVPDDYVAITSGMGGANPTAILIVPLVLNEQVHGAIEIASFRNYENFEIDFIQKLAESIAATVSTVRINEKTKKLLAESQLQGEQLRSQEEEMRQNMEEMNATQEEIQRKESSYIAEIEYLKSEITRLNSIRAAVEIN